MTTVPGLSRTLSWVISYQASSLPYSSPQDSTWLGGQPETHICPPTWDSHRPEAQSLPTSTTSRS